jgi:hypothetical protein
VAKEAATTAKKTAQKENAADFRKRWIKFIQLPKMASWHCRQGAARRLVFFICAENCVKDMIHCTACKKWPHETCAGIGKKPKNFICKLCWICWSFHLFLPFSSNSITHPIKFVFTFNESTSSIKFMFSISLQYSFFCLIYHILNLMARFLNCKYDLGARLPKLYLFGWLRKMVIPIKINFDQTQITEVIAKYIQYILIIYICINVDTLPARNQ